MSTRHKTEKELILDNNGRNVSIRVPERSFVYQGPKNLVKFRKIVSIRHDVVYVECLFSFDSLASAGFIVLNFYFRVILRLLRNYLTV